MPTTDIYANGLVINKLSKAQYDAIQNPSDTELYLVPDEIDNAPTSGSNNPVKSGGVYSALGNKQDNLVFNTAYDATSNKVATMADISNFVQKSSTSGLIKNDGTIDTNTYLTSHQDISNYIQKSSTSGLIRNDGTIDTNTYLTSHQDISNYVQKSSTSGLIKNDGSIDTNTYLTSHQDISNYIQKSSTSGLIKNDGTVDTTAYTTNTGTITGITMNGASKGTSGVIDLGTVITDISGKADKSDAISSLTLSLDNTNYKITLSGTKCNGTQFTVSSVIDLPLESVVVNGSYNSTSKKVILTLQGGSTIEFSVADLVSGLQSEITSSNKLSADLVDDSSATNKFTSTSEKNTWNGKQDALVFNTTYNATTNKVATVSDIPIIYDWAKAASKPSYAVGEISGAVPNTRTVNGKALNANITLSASDVGALSSNTSLFSGSYTDLTDKPTIPTVPTTLSSFTDDLGSSPTHTHSQYLTEHQSLTNYVQKSQTAGLLKNDGTVDTTSYGTYSKPSGGIPASDIASGVIPDDSNLIHKTGDETIAGDKTFSDDVYGSFYGGIYSTHAEFNNTVGILPESTLVIVSEPNISGEGSDALLIVGNPMGNPEGETLEEQATGGWTQIVNQATDRTLQDELDERNNVQADWNQTVASADDYIKNKPTIPAAQIQSDWNQTTTTSLDYIKNKPDITQVNSPAKTITISGVSNTIVVGDTASIGRNNSKIEIGSNGGDDETIRLTTSGSDGGVYVSTDTQKFYYNNKEVATKNDIPTISTDISADYTSDTKTVSPKAVKTFVENKGYSIVTFRQW